MCQLGSGDRERSVGERLESLNRWTAAPASHMPNMLNARPNGLELDLRSLGITGRAASRRRKYPTQDLLPNDPG